jgi:hypothetical protein
MHVIKNSFECIVDPLMHLINISLETGVFPDKLKMAKIIPIFKADDPQLFENYRPISFLTNFSKFYERIMRGSVGMDQKLFKNRTQFVQFK